MTLWAVRRARALRKYWLVPALVPAVIVGTSVVASGSYGASPTLAVDSSSPAVATSGWLGSSPESHASNSFSPPAGSVIVATVFARKSYAPTAWTTESVTDSLSSHLNWVQAKFQGDTSSSGAVGVWWAYAKSAPGAMTVTATLAVGSGQYINSMGVAVDVFTGASATAPIGSVATGDYSGQGLSVPLAPSTTGSALFLAASDGNFTGAPTAGSGDYVKACMDNNNTAAALEWDGSSSGPSLTTSTGAQALTMTGGSASAQFDYVAFEVVPTAAVAPTTTTTQPTTTAPTTTTTQPTTTTTHPTTTTTAPTAALAVDSSSPAVATSGWLGSSPESHASNSFSPPAGSVIVATVFARKSYAPTAWTTESVTDSLSSHLNWVQAKFQGDTSSSGAVGVWWAYAKSAPGAMTVTATLAVGSGQYINSMGVAVDVFTGASATAPIGSVATGDYSGQGLSVPLAPSTTGSALFLAASDGNFTGAPTAGSGDYVKACMDNNNTAAALEWDGSSSGPSLTTSTGPQALTMTGGSASAQFDYVAFEVVPSTRSRRPRPRPSRRPRLPCPRPPPPSPPPRPRRRPRPRPSPRPPLASPRPRPRRRPSPRPPQQTRLRRPPALVPVTPPPGRQFAGRRCSTRPTARVTTQPWGPLPTWSP